MVDIVLNAILLYLAGGVIALCILAFKACFVWKCQGVANIRPASLIVLAFLVGWLYVFDVLAYTFSKWINKLKKK